MQQLRADYINCSNLYSLWHKSLDACSDICVYVLYIYVSENALSCKNTQLCVWAMSKSSFEHLGGLHLISRGVSGGQPPTIR